MKILLVSDNHGDAAILEKIRASFGDQVAAMFHCGDSNLESTAPAMKDFQAVIGNTDWGLNYPEVISQLIDGEQVVVTHGHLYDVNQSLIGLLTLARQKQASLVAFGHTHQLGCELVKDTLFINPGSISQPRGQYAPLGGTFAIVDLTPSAYAVQYYDREMQPVKELAFNFKRR